MDEDSSEEEWISSNAESGQMALPGSNHVRRRGSKRDEKRGDKRGNRSPSSSDDSPVRGSRKGSAKTSKMDKLEAQVGVEERGLLDHRLWRIVSGVFGVTMMIILASLHVLYLATLHENHLWFSNIKEVEREISFRTEAGLYYSYYKQLVNAPSFSQGLEDLTRDNITEHGRTINILERFNIYQEVLLAATYRGFDVKTRPIFFYLYSTFGLQGLLIAAIYAISWSLSGSWVAACLTAVSYTLNRADTTRVNHTAPLRESYSLPFLWCQIFFITCLLRLPQHSAGWKKMFYLALMGVSQFFFILFWQFAQFIFLLQSLALFSAALVGLVPAQRILEIYRVKFCMFLLVCALQFGNKMILTSLVIAFIPAALLVLAIKRWQNGGDEEEKGTGLVKNVFMTIFYILLAFILTSLLNRLVRHLVHHRSDTHVFQFLQHKLGFGDKRNFDAMLYVCTGAFDWLPFDTYERLQTTWLLPLYIVGHVYLIYTLARTLLINWVAWPMPVRNGKERKSEKKRRGSGSDPGIMEPDLAFHTVTSVLFALMGIGALRFKYLWTVYMCIYAGYAVTHRRIYARLLGFLKLDSWALETIRHGVGAMVVTAVVLNNLTGVKKELNDLREFYDPDTVQLMEWINANTAPTAAFSGSMQLLAGVKLCTGRPLTNHPHYEDYELRDRTQKLYGLYGRTPPEKMYATLVHYNTSYVILEDSICLAKSLGCRTPDLVDMTRGQIPDNGDDYGGLFQASTVPRFCHEIRYGKPDYSKYFTLVFSNRTFRVYQVKEPELKPKTTKNKKAKATMDTVKSR